MTFLRKFVAILIMLFMSVLIVPVSTFTAIAQSYFNAEFYQSATFHNAISPLIWESLSETILEKSPLLKNEFTAEEIQNALQKAIPSEVIGDQIAFILQQTEQPVFPEEIMISTEGFKEHLPEVISILMSDKNEVDSFITKETLSETIEAQIPDQISFSTEGIPQEAQNTFLLIEKSGNYLVEGLGSMIIAFTLLIGLVIWKPRSKALGWMGTALFINGALLFLWAQTLKQIVLAMEVTSLDNATIEALIKPVYSHLCWYSLALAILGGIGWIGASQISSTKTTLTA